MMVLLAMFKSFMVWEFQDDRPGSHRSIRSELSLRVSIDMHLCAGFGSSNSGRAGRSETTGSLPFRKYPEEGIFHPYARSSFARCAARAFLLEWLKALRERPLYVRTDIAWGEEKLLVRSLRGLLA